MKISFVLYTDNRPIFSALLAEEVKKLTEAIFDYQCDNMLPDFSDNRALNMAWSMILMQFKRDNKKYNETCIRNAQNGAKGGHATQNKRALPNASERYRTQANQADNDSDNDNVNDNVNVNTNEAGTLFALPNNYQSLPYNQWKEAQFLQSIEAAIANKPGYENIKDKFFEYWTEPDPKGKPKFSKEQTWDTGRRLDNWYQRSSPTKSTDTPESKLQQMIRERKGNF